MLENVDSIGSVDPPPGEVSNLTKIVDELKSIDNGMYGVRVFELKTDRYLLPQSRPVGL